MTKYRVFYKAWSHDIACSCKVSKDHSLTTLPHVDPSFLGAFPTTSDFPVASVVKVTRQVLPLLVSKGWVSNPGCHVPKMVSPLVLTRLNNNDRRNATKNNQ